MATVKCKITSATTNGDGVTKLTLTLTDAQNHSWDKVYEFRQTTPIDLEALKARVIADIKKDLSISTVLDKITPYVGQTITLTI